MESNFSDIAALFTQFKPLDETAHKAAVARNEVLTKPAGSLGRLEELACWYMAVRGVHPAVLNVPRIAVFAGNHGIARDNRVSAFPVEVTQAMVENFRNHGAAINQIAASVDADFLVYELQLEAATKDFSQEPAMSEEECVRVIAYGMMAVDDNIDVIVPGEMGIGNTSAAAAIYHALYGGKAQDWVGHGTGIDDETYQNKSRLIGDAVKKHQPQFEGEHRALKILQHLGGFEIAAIAGLIIAARIARVPVILDGFVSCAAAAILHAIDPQHIDHCIAGHLSTEVSHARVLERLGKTPLLNLQMRLGEASGGGVAIAILRAAVACHNGMATFDEAEVAPKLPESKG